MFCPGPTRIRIDKIALSSFRTQTRKLFYKIFNTNDQEVSHLHTKKNSVTNVVAFREPDLSKADSSKMDALCC